jgi:hypothetical protein
MDATQLAELTALAAARYPNDYESDAERLFALLVDAGEAYIATLQAEEPIAGRSPAADIEMTCVGLEENLEMRLR